MQVVLLIMHFIHLHQPVLTLPSNTLSNAMISSMTELAFSKWAAKNDPRYIVYIDVDGDYWYPGALGAFFAADNSPVMLMTEFERKFIEAEAKVRTGDSGGGQTAYTEAIQASMDFLWYRSGRCCYLHRGKRYFKW
jgi:hypothetical protein